MLKQQNLFNEKSKKDLTGLPNIIFLDIDGVLFTGLMPPSDAEVINANEQKIKELIPLKVLSVIDKLDLIQVLTIPEDVTNNLCKLCEAHDAKIVISSSWRKSYTLEQLKAIFSLTQFGKNIIDCIPIIDKEISINNNRGLEIEAWLQQHQVNSFIILDDCQYDMASRFGERLIFCKTIFSSNSLYCQADKMLSLTFSSSETLQNIGIKPTYVAKSPIRHI